MRVTYRVQYDIKRPPDLHIASQGSFINYVMRDKGGRREGWGRDAVRERAKWSARDAGLK